jgi:hypothetical protein
MTLDFNSVLKIAIMHLLLELNFTERRLLNGQQLINFYIGLRSSSSARSTAGSGFDSSGNKTVSHFQLWNLNTYFGLIWL